MKKTSITLFTYILCLLLMISTLAACRATPAPEQPKTDPAGDPPAQTSNVLTVGYDQFSGRFSPFFARTQNDRDVAALVSLPLLDTDREGNVIFNGITGEQATYNGTDYRYEGLADCTVTQNEDGTVTYDFTLRDNVTFSDGEPLTADDVIFSMYVLADPSYNGSSDFSFLPIQGLADYRAGVNAATQEKYAALADKIWAAGPDATEYSGFTEEQYTAYWNEALAAAGEMFVNEIIDYCLANYGDYLPQCADNDVVLGMYAWGYGTLNEDGTFTDAAGTVYDLHTAFPTKADYWQLIVTSHNRDFSADGIDRDAPATSVADFLKKAFIAIEGPKDENGDGLVRSISGIEKTGDYALRVTMTAFDVTAAYRLGIPVAPLHYYGTDEAYDYENGRFGFTKGDLSGVKSKTAAPLGAGPYVFGEYQDGIVSFTANKTYYKGAPQIETLRFKEVSGDMLAALTDGTVDIASPAFTATTAETVKNANGGTLSGDVLTTVTVDHAGYGYLGINAARVKVGEDAASNASRALRRAFATLFAVYRDAAVSAYYGDGANVIQYPVSNTSWAAPHPDDDGYTVAYAIGADGTALYTAAMTDDERYAAARAAAVAFLKDAGYIWDDETATFIAAPVGAKLSYEVIIAAQGNGDHPNYAVLTAARDALATIGITLEILDVTDNDQLYAALEAGSADMWSAAWSAAVDPDMYPIYHSSNMVGKGGTNLNYYAIADAALDSLLSDTRTATDRTARKTAYKVAMETVLDWGVEIPTYQRQNAVIFSTARIRIDTLTTDITPYWNWMREIETLGKQ